jgi:hypothetical protein
VTLRLVLAAALSGALLAAGAAAAAEPPASGAAPAAPVTATPAPAEGAPPPAGGAPPPAAKPAQAGSTAAPAAKAAPSKGKPTKAAAPGKPAAPAKPPPAPPKPPVPNPALAQLKPLAGGWTCTGRTLGPGPEHATSGALTFAWQLDGFWLEVRYEEQKTAANPAPFSWISQWGFDELQQSLATVTVDNSGGSAAQSAPGWQGDRLVLEGPAHRFTVQFQARDTFVRHGEGQLVHTLEANVNDSWIKLHEDTCNRAPAR